MRNPFRRPTGDGGEGPDFSHVGSLDAARELAASGELAALLLLPEEFGGLDIPPNVVFVPPFVVALKERTDQDTIRPLVASGTVTKYTASPRYDGASFVPTAIDIHAHTPGDFRMSIGVWGTGLQS